VGWKLVLDLQATQSTAHAERGVARYVKEHVRALRRRGEGEAMLLNPHLPFPRRLEQDLLTSPLLQWNTQSVLRAVSERADGPLAYFWMSPFELSLRGEGDLPPHAIRGDIPTIATLYDLIPMRMMDRPPWNDEKLARRTRARAEQLHHIDLVLTISEHTRRDAIELLDLDPRKLVCIGAGVSESFRPAASGETPSLLLAQHVPAITKPFVFCQSGGAPHKNTERLLQAFASVPATHQLVITCALDAGTRARWETAARDAGVLERVVLTDYVREDVLRALYQCASLVVVPSLYEGFGLPVLEAMAAGTPVVTSAGGATEEIAGGAAVLVDPTDADAIAAGIAEAERRRDELVPLGLVRAAAFTWERAGDAVERLWRELA